MMNRLAKIGLSVADLDAAHGVITTCARAVAEHPWER
jgi:hypothetical protein